MRVVPPPPRWAGHACTWGARGRVRRRSARAATAAAAVAQSRRRTGQHHRVLLLRSARPRWFAHSGAAPATYC